MFNLFKAISLFAKLPKANNITSTLLNDLNSKISPNEIQQHESFIEMNGKFVHIKILTESNANPLKVTGTAIDLQVKFNDDKIIFSSEIDSQSDLQIITSILVIEQIANNSINLTDAIQKQNLIINGDQQLLSHLFNILSEYNVDLEFILSKYVGDIGGYYANKAIETVKNLNDSISNNFKGTTSSNPIKSDNPKIQELNKRLEILESRIDSLLNKLS